MFNTTMDKTGDVVKELIRTAQSNPAVGILLCYLLTDMFQDAKLLHDDSALAIKVVLAAGAGIELGSEIATVISDFVPFGSGRAAPSIFTPSATVLVNGSSDISAVLSLLKGSK